LACHDDIVFVFPPATGNVGSFVSHLGVAYLRAKLAEAGIRSSQYINAQPGTISEIAREVLIRQPGIVGFTAYDANFPLCLALARGLKQQQPSIKIIFGGPSVTFSSKELLARHHVIDMCMLGEAEETAPHVIGNLLNGVFPDDHQPGVAFRKDGQVICSGTAPLVGINTKLMNAALDIAPSPYLTGMLDDGRTGVLTGRGCTHHCQYCCFAALAKKTLRLHAVERVIAELEFIAEQRRRTADSYIVPIQDDCFTLLPDRAKRLCEAVIQRDFKLRLSCITRADTVDTELLTLMRAAGIVSLSFGLESAVPSVLRAIGKVRPPTWSDKDLSPEREFIERVRESIVSAKKLGFYVGVSIMLGLPTETVTDGEATLRFVQTLPVDYYAHNFLFVFPGTPLWSIRSQYKLQCKLDEIGMPATTAYAYDVTRLRPSSNCDLVGEARLIRCLAADAIRDCQGPPVVDGSVSTVILEADELKSATAEWLRDILTVGGIVLQVYRPLPRLELKQRMHKDRRIMSSYLVPARYYIQLERKLKQVGKLRYTIAGARSDLCRRIDPRLVSVESSNLPYPLIRWLRGVYTSCAITAVSREVLRSNELAWLQQRIDARHIRSPLQKMPFPPRLEYLGRWLKGLSCQSLSRLEVDNNGNVRCCRFADPIGKVGDIKDKLKKRLSQSAQTIHGRRGCQSCTIPECPRCPFPGLDDQAYCDAIRKSASRLNVLSWIRLYSRIPSMVSKQLGRKSIG
jgi:anaerobic magnesium-protoporphyrin IX monomethyl ester cyclase